MPLLTSWKKLKDWLYSHVHDGVDGSTKITHGDLDGVGVADHHARYTDGEAVAAAKADGDISDAIAKKHTQGTDTSLGVMTANVNMNNHKLTALSVPANAGDSIRQTVKITEAAMEDAADKRHTQGTDTTLGALVADINANNNTVKNLKAPAANGDAVRRTAKITEALLESATDLRHTQGTDTTLGNMAADINANNNTVKNLKAPAANGDAIRQTASITEAALGSAITTSHARSHAITAAADHTSAATPGRMLQADANGLPVDATNTDAAVAAAVTNAPTAGQKAALAEIASNTPATGGMVYKFVLKTGISAAITTTFATVTTTNEAGNLDGGSYSVLVRGTVSRAAVPGAAAVASRSFGATFTRSINSSGGTGVSSAVVEVWETASAATDPATREITGITMTTTESGEYVTNLRINVTHSGTSVGTCEVTFLIELSYIGFLTAPVIAAA